MRNKIVIVGFALLIFILSGWMRQSVYASENVQTADRAEDEKEDYLQYLFNQRTLAKIQGKKELYSLYNKKIKALGVSNVTESDLKKIDHGKEDIAQLAGDTYKTNYLEKRVFWYRTKNGKYYKIMKIVATPKNENSQLYQYGNITMKRKKSFEAGAVNVLRTVGIDVLGSISKLKIIVGGYQYFSAFMDGIKDTTIINRANLTYQWCTAETCTFIYIWDKSIGSYRLGARYNSGTVSVAVSASGIYMKNRIAIASVRTKNYNKEYIPKNNGNIYLAIRYFHKKTQYVSSINNIIIKGINGTIKKVVMFNPTEANEVMY